MKQTNKIIEVYGLWFADLVCILTFVIATYIRFGNFKDMGDRAYIFLYVFVCCFLYGIQLLLT